MAPSRAYIPSRALLRSLSRPSLPPSPFCHPRLLPTQCLRQKRTKAPQKKPGVTENDQELRAHFGPGIPDLVLPKPSFPTDEELDRLELTEEQINDPKMPVISWYEQDLDGDGEERLIQRIATPEDRRKLNELNKMLYEDQHNPDYDDAPLKRRLLDDLMENPNFADLTKEIKALKEQVRSKEEQKKLEEEGFEHPEMKAFEDEIRKTLSEIVQNMLDDPALDDPVLDNVKADLLHLKGKMHDGDDWTHDPEVKEVRKRIAAKLSAKPELLQKETMMEGMDAEQVTQMLEKDPENTLPEGLDELLVNMKDLMSSMGVDEQLEKDMSSLMNEEPQSDDEGDLNRELDFDEITEELSRLAEANAAVSKHATLDEENEKVDPELEAKVDQIMKDPKLMEKIAFIQRAIAATEEASSLAHIPHTEAPDPSTLAASETVSLQSRLAMARSDPEHRAALAALHVKLPSPFNVSPALKSFNQAIELAYVGANEDVRRILWRSYMKARTLPTFLHNISDDAWDLVYYSQAVRWKGNRNRVRHLMQVLDDLKTVGKDGPPTHPSTLVQN